MIPNQSDTVAEVAPTTLELTDYDLSHMIVYLRLLDAARDAPAGRRRAGSSSTLIPTSTVNARGASITAITPAHDG